MSKRHQVHRRHAYGRRQHEVRERIERSHPRDLAEFDADPFEAAEESEGFSSLFDFDLRGRRFNLWRCGAGGYATVIVPSNASHGCPSPSLQC